MTRIAIVTRYGSLALVLALCFLLTGCKKSKVTKENYDKIKTGMTLDEVEAILGKGEQQGDASNVAAQFGVDVGGAPSKEVNYYWESGNKTITVSFRADKVVGTRHNGL